MSFRFQARYALITYAQCGDLPAGDVVLHIESLRAQCIIGRESHADGGIHLHAFIDFGRKFTTRNERLWDVGGRHPNVAPGRRTPEKMWDYATKDGDIVGGNLARPSGTGLPSSSSKWRDIVLAETREEFFASLKELDPRTLVTAYGNVCKYADHVYRVEPEPYRQPDGLRIVLDRVPRLREWAARNLGGDRSGEWSLTPRLAWCPGLHPGTAGFAVSPSQEPGVHSTASLIHS